MSNEPLDWVPLAPSIRTDGDAFGIVQQVATELGSLDWTNDPASEHINNIRLTAFRNLSECPDDEQQIARVCTSVLCDLRKQGWEFRTTEHGIMAAKPLLEFKTPEEAKTQVRAGLMLERDGQLREPAMRKFIRHMERQRQGPNGEWVSIYNLMRDGEELAASLRTASPLPSDQRDSNTAIRGVIDPYIQVVDDSSCEKTGLPLKDIWRYFRATWVNAAKTVPGRNIWFLVRDGAAPYHPVIGIAALGSAIVQLTVRDSWIGWTPDSFLERLYKEPSDSWANWVAQSLEDQLHGIYIDDFLSDGIVSSEDISSPSANTISKLEQVSKIAKSKHQRYPKASEHKSAAHNDSEWEGKSKTYLFRSKRASTLAALLAARLRLQKSEFYPPSEESLCKALNEHDGRTAIKEILRRMKARHIGVDMMDITVCGAIQPYSALLGGKLVSLLLASPEVMTAYTDRYSDTASIIASSMAGRAVRRKPNLVLLGTTSLYSVGSSQYNRIRMPICKIDGAKDNDAEIRYHELGHTLGFGSFHFSPDTLAEFGTFWAQGHGARLVHSIFGEGVNPRLRKIRDALEAVGLSGEHILRHGNKRIVYGIPLASNFREVLLGLEEHPIYLLPVSNPPETTQQMVDFWISRWLAPRITRPGVIERVAQHSLTHPIQHGARVLLPPIHDEESTTLSLFAQNDD